MSILHYRKHLAQDSTAFAKSAPIKTSTYKLHLVADLIKGMEASKALLQLQFCSKKVSYDMHEVLRSAISNAENNMCLDIDRLYISEILVNKAFYLKRFMAKARGRAGRIQKPFSRITIFVSEKK
ncbi:50S ribosomal subunit protein L22 [Alphaproteobacteria bacterium]